VYCNLVVFKRANVSKASRIQYQSVFKQNPSRMDVTSNNVLTNVSITAIDETGWILAGKYIHLISIPIIVIFGLLGNTLSLSVYCMKSMKKAKCKVFLATLAVVDNIFLVVLAVNWINDYFYDILTEEFLCQITVYVTYVASSLSSWCVVGLSSERFIAICFPLQRVCRRGTTNDKVIVGIFVLVSCTLYSFAIWTTSVRLIDAHCMCFFKLEYMDQMTFFTWLDTVVTMMLPFFIIASTNCLVFRAVITSRQNTRIRSFRNRNVVFTKLDNDRRLVTSCNFGRQTRNSTKIQITVPLLLVSTTFLLLNLPAHMVRLGELINSQPTTLPIRRFLNEIAHTLYYCSFSCNILLYTAFGRGFRTSLFNLLGCLCKHRTVTRQIFIPKAL